MRKLLSVVAALLVCASPLYGQETATRAEEEARRQADKAKSVRPEKPGLIERQILAIENGGGFGAPRGFMVTFGDIKSGSGIAPGVAYGKLFNNGTLAVAKVVYSIRNFKLAQLAVSSPPLWGGRLDIRSRVRWQDAPTLAFYQLGTSPQKTRADYSETMTEGSVAATVRPVRLLHFAGSAALERYETGLGDPNKPRIQTVFPTLYVPGLNANPNYVHLSGSAEIDSRDGEGYSRNGTLLRATVHDYRQQNSGPYSFQRLDGAAEQYIPILHGNWVIYAGVHASTTTASDGNEVPFFLMPYVGGSDLRGFDNYRFRDRHAIVFTAEYRWYAQEYVDMAIFYDAGKAVADRRDLDFSGLKSNVGAGIRFHGPRTTVLRVELAKSREGLRLIFAFSPVGG